MKRGYSFVQVNDDKNSPNYRPKHPIINKLTKMGISEIDLVYASHWATDAGWNILSAKSKSGNPIGMWIGFTIKESLCNIEKQNIFNTFN